MVGIILASHGSFSEGILESATMVFGKQPDVAAVTLMPEEGPEHIRHKMEQAIAAFEQQNQILILADLMGGTPYNQAIRLINGQEETRAIVSGLNLPMLITAFSERMVNEKITAHELAIKIYRPAISGIKIFPETLKPDIVQKQNTGNTSSPHTNHREKDTGQGHIQYVLARIDSRLLHGQVATAWTKSVNPTRIIVVSDQVAKDELRKKMIVSAAPPGVHAHVVPISKMIKIAKDSRFASTRALLLFENPKDALKAIEGGVDIKELNIGSMAHSSSKVAVNKVLSLDKEDVTAFRKLKKLGVRFDVRKVPTDSGEDMDLIIDKAEKELNCR